MRFLVFLFLSLLLLSAPARADQVAGGLSAYKSGDYEKALQLWQPLADQGNAEAQFSIASMYGLGHGVKQDYAESAKWLRKAAEQGHAKAATQLGTLYLNGQGVPRDGDEALKWLTKAADAGESGAQNNLGIMYMSGQGVKQDYATALKFLQMAANQGVAAAQTSTCMLYGQGLGVTKDFSKANEWCLKAAEQGFPPAEFNLGTAYEFGSGVDKDYVTAIKWYKKASDQGLPQARQRMLALAAQLTPEQKAAVEKLSADNKHSASGPRVVNVTSDSPPGWQPTQDQQDGAMKALNNYFVALDGGDYEQAYSMMAATTRQQINKDAFLGQKKDFYDHAGKLGKRSVLMVTWTKDPAQGPAPGVYAAIDISARFENVDRYCGYVAVYQSPAGGSFEISREETNFIDNATAQKILKDKSATELDRTWASMSKYCPNYIADASGQKP